VRAGRCDAPGAAPWAAALRRGRARSEPRAAPVRRRGTGGARHTAGATPVFIRVAGLCVQGTCGFIPRTRAPECPERSRAPAAPRPGATRCWARRATWPPSRWKGGRTSARPRTSPRWGHPARTAHRPPAVQERRGFATQEGLAWWPAEWSAGPKGVGRRNSRSWPALTRDGEQSMGAHPSLCQLRTRHAAAKNRKTRSGLTWGGRRLRMLPRGVPFTPGWGRRLRRPPFGALPPNDVREGKAVVPVQDDCHSRYGLEFAPESFSSSPP
jgi:hypothetical protein